MEGEPDMGLEPLNLSLKTPAVTTVFGRQLFVRLSLV